MGEQIHISVGEEQKEKWEEQVEQSDLYASLTHLIRLSVQKEIKRDLEPGDSGLELTMPPGVVTDIDEIKETVETVRKDTSWLRRQREEELDITDFANEVFDELESLPRPTSDTVIPDEVENRQKYIRQRGAEMVVNPTYSDDAGGEGKQPQTAEAIAERLDTTTNEVENALEHLQESFMPVVEVDYDGNTHYFKED